MMDDPLLLTRQLLRFDTANPPGQERQCAQFVGNLLDGAGFRVETYEFAEGRPSIVARLGGEGDGLPVCFAGHMDTVPVGDTPWKRNPLAGEIEGDKIYGRGSSDMKGGIAAMISASLEMSREKRRRAGVTIIITDGEETGCAGARHLALQDEALGRAGAIIVGEPTSNRPVIAHKGALWLKMTTRGVSAHGSMPDQGVNAIYKAANVVDKLREFSFHGASHPVLGKPTLNVGTLSGGTKINMVPDQAVLEVDIRLVPGQVEEEIIEELRSVLGPEVEIGTELSLEAVATDPSDPWIQDVCSLMGRHLDASPTNRGVSYFTDASVLTRAYGKVPTLILGPGEPMMAHKTDEYCLVSKIREAREIYLAITRRWCTP